MLRRKFLLITLAGLVGSLASRAQSEPTVEIISLPHPPAQAALAAAREILEKYAGRVRVVELNAESPEGRKRLAALGLKGHVPILILIDGAYAFKRKDGSAIAFVSFPGDGDSPMGFAGTWRASDLEDILRDRLK